MPLYEYKCSKCLKHFDRLQKFSDPTLTVHEDCGGELERLVSPPAFHFKGSGWYVTDYAKTNGTSPAPNGKSEGSSDTKSESKSDSSSDSKSDSKAEKSESPKPAPASTESK